MFFVVACTLTIEMWKAEQELVATGEEFCPSREDDRALAGCW